MRKTYLVHYWNENEQSEYVVITENPEEFLEDDHVMKQKVELTERVDGFPCERVLVAE